ncbi:sensor histidine kinase [Marinibactrum halimedae]|uniref:histidine kinase n=1 Tax=Marinibactrum halimedae TaxID=1444977 RepID=A0AA37WN24_9GAMM|nr:ATP-binding protein [Marinibactrum halimedae]MCD9461135.1 HAMP domain-containing histidine kinase [Marinibactrum halimedae]GLS24637.1 two-component sensor histidine kinase [Marinibactrum halimedae]
MSEATMKTETSSMTEASTKRGLITRLFRGNTVQSRLALALTASFFVIGLSTLILMVCSNWAYQQEVTQVMHRDVADYVAEHYLPFTDGKPDLNKAKKTFHDLMMLGPNFEFYWLDLQGNILAYSAEPGTVVRESVTTEPLILYLDQKSAKGLTFGDDPRHESREKIFSVAPIVREGITEGYLYVILGSQIFDRVSDRVWNSKIVQWSAWLFTAVLLFGLISLLWLTGLITRPLTQLTEQVTFIRKTGFSKAGIQSIPDLDPSSDEPKEVQIQKEQSNAERIRVLNQWQCKTDNEIHALGCAFREALETIHEQYKNIVTIDELRKELLSHVSHDLRTPLASLLGYLETWEINQASLTEEQSRQYIATAKKSAQRISSLVEQLFELAHLDSGTVTVHKERFSIAELIEDVLQKFRIDAESKRITLAVTPQDSGIWISGDIEKLERVFTNLVENALRHTPDDGSITVRLNEDGNFVAIEVADTGIGIPDEDIPHIFDPHYKAGNSVRGNTAHGGLGLAITKRLLELHQSNIRVSSRMNQGTCFSFALPKQA